MRELTEMDMATIAGGSGAECHTTCETECTWSEEDGLDCETTCEVECVYVGDPRDDDEEDPSD